eukprot:m.114856 g.114856  ORF g.114856 m.114856 type:complete len:161 (+) comp51904_c0_seq2:250-732(+)
MRAASNGATVCARVLLRRGVDSTIKNLKGRTALDIAQMNNQTEFIALLEDHELYLAQLGSHTKPALREPVLQFDAQADASTTQPVQGSEQPVLLLPWDTHSTCEPVEEVSKEHDGDGSRLAAAEDGADADAGLAEAAPSLRQPLALPAMNLGELDFELPD